MAPLLLSSGGGLAVAWVMLLLLPLSVTPLRAGNFSRSRQVYQYDIFQPEHISGLQGGSAEIFFFIHIPRESDSDLQMRISWRWQHFHGPFIYNSSPPFIAEHFKDRLFLAWTEGQPSGVLRILNLRDEDESTYFCRVRLSSVKSGPWQWQSMRGTKLTVTQAAATITQSRSAAVTRSQGTPVLNLAAIVGVVVATAVLISPGVGMLLILLRWRSSRPAD